MTLETSRTFLLPKISEREPAGKLIRIPGIVEATATKPVQKPSGVPRLAANEGKTGFFDIVELRIANTPMMQSIKKMWCLPFSELEVITESS